MLLLVGLEVHDALAEVRAEMQNGEHLFAFLEDFYVVSPRDWMGHICMFWWTRCISFDCTQATLGCGTVPGFCHPNTRRVDSDPTCGVSPGRVDSWYFGSDCRIAASLSCEGRVEEESWLWEAIAWFPDLKCAWQMLHPCAQPRCHHVLKTMLPTQPATCTEGP